MIVDIKGPRTIVYHSVDKRPLTSMNNEKRVSSSLKYVKIKKLKNKKKLEKVIGKINKSRDKKKYNTLQNDDFS